MSARRTTRPLSTALAAAVLAGGLAATAAAPALAAPAETTDGSNSGAFWPDPENGRFTTQHSVKDVRITVAPYTVTSGEDELLSGEKGKETDVEFSYDAELERGIIDFTEQRRVLGENGTGDVVFTLYTDGDQTATAHFGPDADLSDATPGELKGVYGPQSYDTTMRPTVDHVTLMSAPGSRMVYLQGGPGGDAPGMVTLTVTEQPKHGTLVVVPREGESETVGHRQWESTVYVADEGFTGTDQAVFTVTDQLDPSITRTLVVTFSVGDERADDTVLDPTSGGLPYDEARVWAALAEQGGDDAAPAEPADPAEPVADDDAEQPAPGDHTVPDAVETGNGQAWSLAALGALGAGGLVAARRRFVLTR